MKWILPRSLAGRLMLVLGAALILAQIVNFALILNERQKLSLVQNISPAVTRFASAAADVSDAAPEFRAAIVADLSRRGAQYRLVPASLINPSQRSLDIEQRLSDALVAAGVRARAVRATDAVLAMPPRRGETGSATRRVLGLEAQLASGEWLAGALTAPARDPWLNLRLAAGTAALLLIVLGASLLILRQVTQPLQALALAAERFRGRAVPEPVPLVGPEDVRKTIRAFNEMNMELLRLLDEKDRVLGAIGHDLRTPLASLRIRVEQMEPEDERAAAIRKLEEMARILEDILMLAQTGRLRATMRSADVTSIVDAVVEEFRDLGRAVDFEPGEGHILAVQPDLLRRAISNLVDNGLKYGSQVAVAVSCSDEVLRISVSDTGPGVDPALLSRVHEPFFRGEESRNRQTGGAGLGLAIATSIAELHGGTLDLRNLPSGFVAELQLPVTQGQSGSA